MLSLTVLGPATAMITVAGHRILLGTADAPPVDPIAIILSRTSVEDAARLPRILRNHNRIEGKPTVVTGDTQHLMAMLRADEVCAARVADKEMDLSLESYATISAVPDEPGKNLAQGVYKSPGFAIFVDRCGWMRDSDALRVWLYCWDHKGEHDAMIKQALLQGDAEAFDEINRREQDITHDLAEISKRISEGERVDPSSVPKPIIKRYLWAPYCREQGPGFAHITFTMRRTPHNAGDPSAAPARAAMPRCTYIEHVINKEFHL